MLSLRLGKNQLTLNIFLFCMNQNYQIPIVAGQNQQYYSRSSQNIGVPANNRLIHEPLTYNPPNNYIISSQAQQYYPPAPQINQLTIPNTVYQNSVSPRISYSSVTPSAGLAYQEGGQLNSFTAANSHKVVRSRLVPVTQYVPVHEYEEAPPSSFQNTSIHQRIILHQPENFKERIIYDEKLQAHPTMVEEVREVEAPVQATTPRVVKVSQDPLVETVPGSWKSRLDVGASRTSYAPPPLPREEKPCCSGWLLLLLGLLALGGLLTAILLAKNSSSEQINTSNQATVSGTKVSAAPTKVSTVAPLTDAKIEFVKGNTAVASPLPISSLAPQTVRPVEAVIPTDITKVAVTAPSTLPNSQVQPEKTGFMPVKPIVVSNPSVAVIQPYIVPTPAVIEPALTIQPERPVSRVKVSSAVPVIPVPAKIEPVEAKTATTQPITIQPYSIQPSLIQPGTILPYAIQPSSVQPYSIQPNTAQPNSIQPNLIQPSTIQPGRIQAVPYQAITVSKVNATTTPTLLPSDVDENEKELAEKALLASKNGFLSVAEVEDK